MPYDILMLPKDYSTGKLDRQGLIDLYEDRIEHHFPYKRDETRDHFPEICATIYQQLSKYDNIFIEMPTGCGKSGVVKTVAEALLEAKAIFNYYVMTPKIGLMEQYEREKGVYLYPLKGKGNFRCPVSVCHICPIPKTKRECKPFEMCKANHAPCNWPRFKCPEKVEARDSYNACSKKVAFKLTNCEYLNQYYLAVLSPRVLSNPAYVFRAINGDAINRRSVAFYDEAHNLPDVIRSLITTVINESDWDLIYSKTALFPEEWSISLWKSQIEIMAKTTSSILKDANITSETLLECEALNKKHCLPEDDAILSDNVNIRYRYALNANKKIVNIDTVTESGQWFQCPECEGRMIAKLGKVRVHHFSHLLESCPEAVIHFNAKHYLTSLIEKGCEICIGKCDLCQGEFKYMLKSEKVNIGRYVDRINPDIWFENIDGELIAIDISMGDNTFSRFYEMSADFDNWFEFDVAKVASGITKPFMVKSNPFSEKIFSDQGNNSFEVCNRCLSKGVQICNKCQRPKYVTEDCPFCINVKRVSNCAKDKDSLDSIIILDIKLQKILQMFMEGEVYLEQNSDSEHYGKYVKFVPVEISKAADRTLTNVSNHRIFLSATFLDPKFWINELGQQDKSNLFIMLEQSPTPVRNRIVTCIGTKSLSFKKRKDNLTSVVRTIDSIIDAFPGKRGLILPVAYSIQEIIERTLQNQLRLVTHRQTPDGRADAMKIFLKSERDDLVLMSPYYSEGFDGRDDLCRFLIIVKVPYPSLGDPMIVRKMVVTQKAYAKENGCEYTPSVNGTCSKRYQCNRSSHCLRWYYLQTATSLVQMMGRIIRHKDDHGSTFILDIDFKKFYKKHIGLFPFYVRQAICFPGEENKLM